MSDLLNSASLVMIPSGYKEDVVYSQIPTDGSGDLTFTRASNGTRINSAGLVEVVPWNLLTYSNDFSSSWALIEASKSTGVTDPIGNANAIKLKYTTATSGHYITQGISLTGSNAHSVYAKAGELQFLQIASAQSINEYANFNLSTGLIGTYGSYASNVQIENVGNGWYRCSVVFTNGTNGIYLAIVQSASSDWFGISTYAGANSTNGLYLYGGQVNAGTLKPYFPTTDRLNVPRLTYQNGGGGCPSLLLEKQSTNVNEKSNDFTLGGGYWYELNSKNPTANQGISPDGTNNAWSIQSNSFLTTEYGKFIGGTIGDKTAGSIWAKGSETAFTLSVRNTTNSDILGSVTVNLTTGAITSGSGTVESFGNGWYRISTIGTSTITNGYPRTAITNPNTSCLIYGSQFEASSYPTSYIPTTSSSATRVADACYKTGISSLIGQTQGTLFIDFVCVKNSGFCDVISMGTDGSTGIVELQINGGASNTFNAIYYYSGFVANIPSLSTLTIGQRYKAAFAYKTNDFAFYLNGVQQGTDTSGTVNSGMSEVSLNGYASATNNRENALINEAVIFPTRLTNAELASLTTI